jgi:hypothetical protein
MPVKEEDHMRLFGFRPSRVVISGTVVAMVAALAPALVASTTNAGAAAAHSSVAAAPAVATRTIVRQHSLSSLAAAVGNLPRGTKGPETPPGEGLGPDSQASIATRSHSARPDPRALLATAATGLPIPVVASTAVSMPGGPKLKQSFEGLNLYQERYVAANGNQFTFEPPDQGMCVGNGMVLETINDALRVFSTSGTALSPPIDLNSFYGYPVVINRTTGVFGPELTDPSCFFDSVNQRWIHIALTLDVKPKSGALTLNNHVDIAVSKTADPLGGWVFYSFNTTDDGKHGTPSHTDCPCIGDYPHIGADRNGVYITVNQYPWSSGPGVFGTNFNGSQLYAMSRKALASGAATVRVVQLQNLALTGGAHPVPGFTTIPANAPDGVFADANGGTEYFVSTTAAAETGNAAGRSDNIGFWTLSNTQSLDGDHLALTLDRAVVPSEVYAIPPRSEQKLGNVPLRDCLVTTCLTGVGPSTGETEGGLDSSDTRPFNTWFDGTRVWATLSTAVEVSHNIHAGSAWFALDPAGTISDQGYVAVADNNVIYAGLATLPSGRGAMGVTLVGHDFFPTAAYALVGAGGPGSLHVSGAGAGPQDGFCEYVFFNCGQTQTPTIRPRWGDFPAAQTSGDSIFLANEYIAQTCTFAQYEADPFCGTTRGVLANWSTHVSQITP